MNLNGIHSKEEMDEFEDLVRWFYFSYYYQIIIWGAEF